MKHAALCGTAYSSSAGIKHLIFAQALDESGIRTVAASVGTKKNRRTRVKRSTAVRADVLIMRTVPRAPPAAARGAGSRA